MYTNAIAKSILREYAKINANTAANTTMSRKGWRERKSMSLKL